MPDSPADDDAILARLNALKGPSPGPHNIAKSPKAETSDPHDDLAARFARLGSASPACSPTPSRIASTRAGGAPAIAPGAPSYLEGIAEGIGGGGAEVNEEDDRSLEELLAELGPREEWDLKRGEESDVGRLLREVKRIVPEVERGREGEAEWKEGLTDWENVEVEVAGEDQHGGKSGDGGEKGRTEDEEAEEIIARVMAELEISREFDPLETSPGDEGDLNSGDQKSNDREDGEEREDDAFALPSAPTSLPQDDLDRTQAIEDALTARLAALSSKSIKPTDPFSLPSAPSFSPTKKPPKVQSSLAKKLDKEIETWCIICSDDATLRCLGCDGDLYCRNCWMEGHRGESVGFEERKHRAVEFVKDGKKKKAVAV